MDNYEDQTAPISEAEIKNASRSSNEQELDRFINKVLDCISERRDSYNGVVSSFIYLIGIKNDYIINNLRGRLLEILTQQPIGFAAKIFLTKALYRLIAEQPQFIEDLFEYIIESTNDWRNKLSDDSQVTRIQIISLKAIKQAEHSRFGRPTRLKTDLIERICYDAMRKGDDSTKIDTLNLVLESRSTTKILVEREFYIYKVIFMDAICLQDPALRQMFIALTNKLIKRLKDSYKVVIRDLKRFTDEERSVITEGYRNFLEWLINTCLDCNYCNAYFGSFVLTISSLKLVIAHITYSEEGLPIEQLLKSRRCYDSILCCLSDSFEENKKLGLKLLLSLPYNEEFYSNSSLSIFNTIAYELIDSVNPAHSLTCQYVFKLLVGLEEKKSKFMLCDGVTKNKIIHKHITNLLARTDTSVKSARDNFTMALKGSPVYPKLTCIRSLLEEVDISTLDDERDDWVNLCRTLVRSSIEACQSVSAIVCNLNPETIGHLPMDIKPIDPVSLAKSFNISVNIMDRNVTSVTSQMLLISGWKTIKECSLTLGTLCERFWWPQGGIKIKKEKFPGLKSEPILDREDIARIMSYFDHYLRNLRHRGAFEQAYNGFIMVTKRIWHDDEFRKQLIETLRQIMNDFRESGSATNKKHLEAYVTRRSAGLPFIVQAILISEHKQESNNLNFIMNSLFEVLDSEKSEEYQQIHCMNILRALIKEHNLGEKVLSHTGKTLSITLKAFRSSSFSIRNCANMLLKAVVDRTFGVNRLKDEIHRKNQLSFERFFTEYPNLHPEMIYYLKTDVNDRQYLPSIHSVFIVLSRLKASTNPSSNYTFDKIIMPFVPLTMKWALFCPDYKLRQVAAKLLVQLTNHSMVQQLPIEDTSKVMLLIIESFDCVQHMTDLNRIHGVLSIMKFLVDSDSVLFHRCKSELWLSLMDVQKILTTENNPMVCLKLAFLQVLESWYLSLTPQTTNFDFLTSPKTVIESILNNNDPQAEQALFKYISFLLIDDSIGYGAGNLNTSESKLESHSYIANIIFNPKYKKICSMNLQAALIRLIRQIICRECDVVDSILDTLDLDTTAAHETPFDRLKYRKSEGLGCSKLETFLSRRTNLANTTETVFAPYLKIIANLSSFHEFQPDQTNHRSFSLKSSNTPRSIECLAFACKTKSFRDVGYLATWSSLSETDTDRLKFLCDFISQLPDSDLKSLALIEAGQTVHEIDLGDKDNIEVIDRFSRLINRLADEDHSFIIRKSICNVLLINFNRLVSSGTENLHNTLSSLVGALIKLSRDSEGELRSLSLKIISSLSNPNRGPVELVESGSRLDPLIWFISEDLFDPNDMIQMNQCVQLLTEIIFETANINQNEMDESKEQLFDKTKLNTFADQIVAIKSALVGLKKFFKRRSESIHLNNLQLPSEVLAEMSLGLKRETKGDIIGDYSWRIKQVDLQHKNQINDTISNSDFVLKLLQEIFDSFEYFSKGYWNILTDTKCIYNELSLYRFIAFVIFVLDCFEHNIKSENYLKMINDSLTDIVQNSCATTILTKCIDLLKSDYIST